MNPKILCLTAALVLLLATGCGDSNKGKPITTVEEALTQQVRLEQARNAALEKALASGESLQKIQLTVVVILGCALAASLFTLARRKKDVP